MTDRDRHGETIQGLERLEPPRGGLAGLHRKIRRRTRRRRVLAYAVAPGAAAALLFAALVVVVRPAPRLSDAFVAVDSIDAIRLGLRDAPEEPVTVPTPRRADTAVLRIPTRNPRVVMYSVESLSLSVASGIAPVSHARSRDSSTDPISSSATSSGPETR